MQEIVLSDAIGSCADPSLDDAERDLFFSEERAERAEAIEVYCEGCPIRDNCLRVGLGIPKAFGVYGGVQPEAINIMNTRPVGCIRCAGTLADLYTRYRQVSDGGRWPHQGSVHCSLCGFSFDSNNAAREVDERQARIYGRAA